MTLSQLERAIDVLERGGGLRQLRHLRDLLSSPSTAMLGRFVADWVERKLEEEKRMMDLRPARARRWEEIPVRNEIRKALLDWANWEAEFGPEPEHSGEIASDLKEAARQFREDVLAAVAVVQDLRELDRD